MIGPAPCREPARFFPFLPRAPSACARTINASRRSPSRCRNPLLALKKNSGRTSSDRFPQYPPPAPLRAHVRCVFERRPPENDLPTSVFI
ncbi:hypothetical protein HMPREF3036_01115 [Sutterella sp. KLE1602]|nr:hypothetical protein HMPREF3036_01115 [Sutterella sp. KLE1602]